MEKKLEQSPGTQRKYFTQETNTFAPFYFSYRTPCGLEGEKTQQNTHLSSASNSKLGSGSLKKLMNFLEKLGKVSSLHCNPDPGKKHAGLLPPQGHTCRPDSVSDPHPCLGPRILSRGLSGFIKKAAHSVQEEHLFLSCLALAFAEGQERLRAGVNSHNKATDAPMLSVSVRCGKAYLHWLTLD